jgi:hypothetical protein
MGLPCRREHISYSDRRADGKLTLATDGIIAMPNPGLHHRIAKTAKVALVLISISSVVSWGQTTVPNGNVSSFKDWQPSREGVSAEERAAGVRQSPAQRNAEDRELQQINQGLMRQEQPSSSTQLSAPK